MASCKQCGSPFSKRFVTPEGRETWLGGRTRCLTCSPFRHRAKRNQFGGTKLDCKTCYKDYIYRTGHGHSKEKCPSCLSNHRRFALKEKMLAYKGGKCLICGYDRCNTALTFHHTDPKTKLFNLSGSHCRKWDVIQKELDKCVLICQNCHAEIHAGIVKIPVDI